MSDFVPLIQVTSGYIRLGLVKSEDFRKYRVISGQFRLFDVVQDISG
jgi:hypothetical protein